MDIQILKNFAKKLIPLSIEAGQVSEQCVKSVLQSIEKSHFTQIQKRRILKYYLAGIKKEIKRSQAVIEFAGELSNNALNLIQQKLSTYYHRPIAVVPSENKSLLAGLRISVSDDVWDSSVQGRLNNFQQKFSH